MSYDDTNRFKPYPELVEGSGRHPRPYRIIDSHDKPWLPSNGMTDKLGRALYVPLRPDGRYVSRHELAHVKWSPRRMPRLPFNPVVLQAIEDARINLGLAGRGIPLILDEEQLAHVRLLGARDAKSGPIAALLLRTVASLGTNVESELLAVTAATEEPARGFVARWVGEVRDRLTYARRRCATPVAPFRIALDLAHELARELEAKGLLDADAQSGLAAIGCCLGAPDPEARARSMRAELRGRRRGGPVEPGEMKLAEPPLDVERTRTRAGRARRWRAAPEGAVFGAPHRYAIDGAIFRHPARRVGGSVLVDTSGSMSFGEDDVDAIVDAARGAGLVAIYSGRRHEGELRVVARGGRRATRGHLKPFGSGNIVDVPALEWLAKQAEPRVWVSDGGVTGCNDDGSAEITGRCGAIRKRSRIRRVRKAGEAAALLERRSR